MNLIFKTTKPNKLKSDILKLIEDEKLKTWKIHNSNNIKYIKHIDQWGDKGVIKMSTNIQQDELIVEVFKFEKTTQKVEEFSGYYLGRFCEIIFVNFPNDFNSITK
ncbi:hypothetical protein [Flavobacterium piscisymbiosum]|uniref:DUF4286 family protein n=1 Tax=Flavobacterium piscisymbiosum TaxID=2893753 RepID=A0ABS8MGL4_9FLAO|nr:hypothetical protein [Flavobacterium sp. F-30]MCC9064631.1 hypothetical protein [Flavobacterium sp. F-30]